MCLCLGTMYKWSTDGRQWPTDAHELKGTRQTLKSRITNPGNWKINNYSFKTNLNWHSSKFSNHLSTFYIICGELKPSSREHPQMKVALHFILAKIWIAT